ncbi:MAG TPA: ABC transporter ATP-binding protein [Candidatus Saccharimonadales bacterium]|nr:ABC transporter ATP-binding protein [Candidatus Saccharimonadales bacterium]
MLVPGSIPGEPTREGSTDAIEVRGLTRLYGPRRGIEDLTLTVGVGEIFGFLGPNGAGKTTTIRLLLGLIRPDRGSGSILGHDLAAASVAVRRRIGFLSGDVALQPALTVAQYLRFLGSFTPGYRIEQARPYAERFGLDLGRRIKGLSKGNRQKVGLVAALQHRPEVLILDEPTSGLDPLLQQEMHRVIREERSRGATVFFSSHDLAEVQSLCDRAAVLRDAALVQVVEVASLGRLRERRYLLTYPDGRVMEQRVSGDISSFLREVAAAGIIDLREREVTLEETFLSLYGAPPA